MPILYLGNDINKPSHLWMRRMLGLLGPDLAQLVTEAPLKQFAGCYQAAQIPVSRTAPAWKFARRTKLIRHLPVDRRSVRWLIDRIERPEIELALVHYLTLALKYEPVWRATDKPIFVHCHGQDVTWDLRLPGNSGQLAHPPDYVQRVQQLPANVQFIANSLATCARLEAIQIPRERIHLKYLGVPVPDVCPARNRSRSDVTILYLGRLIDFKGPVQVIEAFDRACQHGLKGRLVIAGDGDQWAACQAAREASPFRDHIVLLGATDEATGIRLRGEADIFTAHNRLGPISQQEEAFGVSCVEAMAAALPVVSGRNGSLPEIIEDGREGLLVEPGDVEAHAEALLRLARDREPRATLGQNAWQRAREQFSLEREQKTLFQILGIRNVAPPLNPEKPLECTNPSANCLSDRLTSKHSISVRQLAAIDEPAGIRLRVAVCAITYRRPDWLRRMLDGLGRLEFSSPVPEIRVIIVENETEGPGKTVCEAVRKNFPFPLEYFAESRRGIPAARNRSIREAQAVDFVALIDDDEVPTPRWLDALLRAQRSFDADLVAGPVLSSYEPGVPAWVVRSRLFQRQRFATGTPMLPLGTNNVLIRREILNQVEGPFDERFALCGGSDTHLFRRLSRAGHQAVWADDAIVHEWAPPSRTTVAWALRRAFRSGANYTAISFDLAPTSQALTQTLFQTCKYLGWGLVGLPFAPLHGRPGMVRHAKHIARGLGLVAGLAGIEHQEYRTIHGQ